MQGSSSRKGKETRKSGEQGSQGFWMDKKTLSPVKISGLMNVNGGIIAPKKLFKAREGKKCELERTKTPITRRLMGKTVKPRCASKKD